MKTIRKQPVSPVTYGEPALRSRSIKMSAESDSSAFMLSLSRLIMRARIDASDQVIMFAGVNSEAGVSTISQCAAHIMSKSSPDACACVLRLSADRTGLSSAGKQPIHDFSAVAKLPPHRLIELSLKVSPSLLISSEPSAYLKSLLEALRGRFDRVILDISHSQNNQLAFALAPIVDGYFLVAESEVSRIKALEHFVDEMDALDANLYGTILNKRKFHIPNWVLERI